MSEISLPEWLPTEAWDEFVDMRKRIKMPLTDYAKKLSIRKLEGFRKDGQDVQAVLDEAILRQWRGLWPLDIAQAPASPAKLSLVSGDKWHMTDRGIEAKARECGIIPRPGEFWGDVKNRVFRHLENPSRKIS